MEAKKDKSPPATPPTSPVVKMKKLPFYKTCGEIVKPMKLASKSSAVSRKIKVHFIASPKIFSEIIRTSEAQLVGRILQMQLRFCLWNCQYPQADHLPLHLIVRVNQKVCFVLREKESIQHPIDITDLVHLSDVVPNVIKATWSLTDRRDYAMSICWVKQLTTVDLLQELWAKDVFPIDNTLAIIKEEMEAHVANDANIHSLRVSLMCPLGQSRLSVPCRAPSCSHLQVFDAIQYLQRNEEKEMWRCPICNRKTLYESLVIDEFFLAVLNTGLYCEEIELLPDGSWYPIEPWRDLRDNYDTLGASGFQASPFPESNKENLTFVQIGNSLANIELQDPAMMNTIEVIRPQQLPGLFWGLPQDRYLQPSRSLLSSLQPTSTGNVNFLPCLNVVTQPIDWTFTTQNSHNYSHGLPWCPPGLVQAPAPGPHLLSGWLPPPPPVGIYAPWSQHPPLYGVQAGWGRGVPAFQPLFGYQLPPAQGPCPTPVQVFMPMGVVGNPVGGPWRRGVFRPPVPPTQVAPAHPAPAALSIQLGGEAPNLASPESKDENVSLKEENQTQQPPDPPLAPPSHPSQVTEEKGPTPQPHLPQV
ncbi:E3 SUMO-protein ligase PIAS3-like isoform X2 [Ornithorhynchus anatinus]|uniref:SP-RING-type domain-containing protein n=1 Tax=Ornithorhynchus anatinus TaxID=9258 RepID=K7ED30_ORNAN|nr:E3 SUMO-protein ligase PIAS3-like isoform X2 [Ornithorhynchus anatinus]